MGPGKQRRTRESKRLLQHGLAMALVLGLTACSTDGPTNSAGTAQAPGVSDYIPLNSGYSSTFIVTDENGVEIRRETYTAGAPTSVNGNPGVYWTGGALDTAGAQFTSILYNSGTEIIQTRSNATNQERLLAEPLEVGASWNRWVVVSINDTSSIDTVTVGGGSDGNGLGVNNDGQNKPFSNDGPSGSSFPTKGSSTFYIKSLDDTVTSGSRTYEDCLQVVNTGDGLTVNRYWYCPGVGLVKYALNCQPDSNTGTENGNLIG